MYDPDKRNRLLIRAGVIWGSVSVILAPVTFYAALAFGDILPFHIPIFWVFIALFLPGFVGLTLGLGFLPLGVGLSIFLGVAIIYGPFWFKRNFRLR